MKKKNKNKEKEDKEIKYEKKLSIIVPCYKVEKYLPRCLDSLVNQTLDGVEAICINDGSPDNCLKILKDYQKKYGDKIVIIDKKNEGVWKGRHDGIKIAKGEFIGFVDSDDYVTLDFAEKLYNAAKKENADIAICGFDRIDMETEKVYSREMCKPKHNEIMVKENAGLLLEINGAPWNKIYKSEILKNSHDLENVPKILDDMMFIQLAYLNTNKIVFITDSLNRYMVRSDSIINTINLEKVPSTYAAMKEIRDYYKKEQPDLLEYVDANAFLHLGVSLMYRLHATKGINFKKELKKNTKFLDEEFPLWRKNKYIKHKYVRKNKGSNRKLWIVRQFYRFHLFRPFLAVYSFMINKFKIDIKW
jgi:glycosyltransferase involved in cell wall biosynthesis